MMTVFYIFLSCFVLGNAMVFYTITNEERVARWFPRMGLWGIVIGGLGIIFSAFAGLVMALQNL